MAVLTALPDKQTISSFKGVLDFYLWKGIPVARKWPHYPKRQPHPNEKANQDALAYCVRSWKNMPEYLKEGYRSQAQGTPLTARDLFVRAYLAGIDY